MQKPYIIANWKANKDLASAQEWVSYVAENLTLSACRVIICPSFVLLPSFKEMLRTSKLHFALGAQDVSSFSPGAHTGEVVAEQLNGLADHVIIGHSERRKEFREDDNLLEEKVGRALSCGIEPIFCVKDDTTFIPASVRLIAYEPIFAIGSGQADTPESAERVAHKLATKDPQRSVVYGGSVTPDNANNFLKQPSLSGLLIGKDSLDPKLFTQILNNL